MSEVWGVRDLSGTLGPEPFLMPSEAEARKGVEGDPLAEVVVKREGTDVWVPA